MSSLEFFFFLNKVFKDKIKKIKEKIFFSSPVPPMVLIDQQQSPVQNKLMEFYFTEQCLSWVVLPLVNVSHTLQSENDSKDTYQFFSLNTPELLWCTASAGVLWALAIHRQSLEMQERGSYLPYGGGAILPAPHLSASSANDFGQSLVWCLNSSEAHTMMHLFIPGL